MYLKLMSFLAGCFFYLCNTAIAQDSSPKTIPQFPLIHLGQKDGLIPNYINDLAVDSLGQLQLATFGGGIISYGGYEFSTIDSYKLSKFPIIRKLKVIDNNYYFITSGELYNWNSSSDSIELVFKDDSPILNFYQLAPNKILISNYRGNFIAERSLGKYNVSPLPTQSPITQIVKLRNNNTLGVLGDGKIISDIFNNTPNILYENIDVGNIKVFEMDDFLVVVQKGFISYLDKENYRLIHKITTPLKTVFSVFFQDDQTIWMGGDKGLYTLDNKELIKIITSPQLSDLDISAITKTKDGILWISTYGQGLFKLYDRHVHLYSIDNIGLGQIYSITPIAISPNEFIITSTNGLYHLVDEQFFPITLPPSAKSETFSSGVDIETGSLFVGGEGYILKKEFGSKGFRGYFHDVFTNNVILSIVPWKGNLFIGSQRGLYLFDSEFNLLKDFNEGSSLKIRNVYQIHVIDDNHIVYGDFFNLYETDFHSVGEFEVPGIKGKILSFKPIGDNMFWLGTSSGILYLYDFNKDNLVRQFHSKHGKNIYSISIAPDHGIVLGTEMGIEKHYEDGSYKLYDDRVRQFEVNYNSLAHMANGDLLIGTVGGLLKVSAEYGYKKKNHIWLETLLINNNEIFVKDYLRKGEDLILPFDANNLSFKINLVNFLEPDNTQLRYRLVGYEDDWGQIMNTNSVQYTNLPPGEYRIMVNVRYSQGDELSFTMPLNILIRPPYWHHPIFILFITAFGIGLVYLGFIRFQRKTLNDNIKLQHLVESRTQEINDINKNLENQIHYRTLDLYNKNKELIKTINEKNIFQSHVRLISSNTQDIVCLISPNYTITLISDTIEEMLGIPSSEIVNKHIVNLVSESNCSEQLIAYLNLLEDQSEPVILSLLHRVTKENVLVEILGKQVFKNSTEVIQGYVLNIRNVTEREFLKAEVREVYKNIHRDFHDEVGNKLAKIIALISVLKIQMNKIPTSGDTMGKIENTAKNLYHDTRDFIWSLDLENNKLEELSIQLRDFGQMLYDGSDTQFRCDLDIEENILLKPNLVRDILLIMKEIMTNVLKHAQATIAFLIIKQRGQHLVFIIKDNGIGIKTPPNGKGNGLKNIQYRTVRCNGELILRSRKGSLIGIRIKN